MTKEVKEKELAEAPVAQTSVAPVKIKAEKPAKHIANGVFRPHVHTKCGAIWTVADHISATNHRPAEKQEVLDKCAELGYNLGNSKDEYARWKRYNGLTRSAKKIAAPDLAVETVVATATEMLDDLAP